MKNIKNFFVKKTVIEYSFSAIVGILVLVLSLVNINSEYFRILFWATVYDGSSWSKGTQTGSAITKKSYFWVGDPSNYGYPAVCRALTTSYPYQSGAM